MATDGVQARKSFGTLLDCPRLETPRALSDTQRGDHAEQCADILLRLREELPAAPGHPYLNRMFETVDSLILRTIPQAGQLHSSTHAFDLIR